MVKIPERRKIWNTIPVADGMITFSEKGCWDTRFGLRQRMWQDTKEKYILRSFNVSLFLAKYHPKDQIQEDKMGSACDKYGEEEEYVQGFGWET